MFQRKVNSLQLVAKTRKSIINSMFFIETEDKNEPKQLQQTAAVEPIPLQK